MIRELTVTILVMNDDTCWLRSDGAMHQLPTITGTELDGGGPVAPEKTPKRAPTMKRITKSGGANRQLSTRHRGGRDIDWDDLATRYAAGETAKQLAARAGVSTAAVYYQAKKGGWTVGPAKPPRAPKPAPAPIAVKRERAEKRQGLVDGRRYCKECGQTSPPEQEKCLHCFERFAV